MLLLINMLNILKINCEVATSSFSLFHPFTIKYLEGYDSNNAVHQAT